MDFHQFKLIEQYFKLGTLIEKNQDKLSSLSKLKAGYLSLKELNIIQKELSSLGLESSDYLDLKELYEEIVNECNRYNEVRKELKEECSKINVDIDKIIYEKRYFENLISNSYIGG